MTLEKLAARADALVAEATALADKATSEDRPMTEEELTKHASLLTEVDAMATEIKNRKAMEDHRKHFAASAGGPPGDGLNQDPLQKPEKKFANFGDFLLASRDSLRPGATIDERLATGSSEGTPSDGGFFVQSEFQTRILEKVWAPNKLAGLCDRITVGANANGIKINYVDETSRAAGYRAGGVLGYWLAEAALKTATKPKVGQIDMKLQKVAAVWYTTDELAEDTTAMGQLAERAFGDELSFLTEEAIVRGTGAGQPLGILNAPCLVSVAAEGGQAAGTILAENVEKMYARFWAPSVPNARWLINQDCWPQIFQLHHAVGMGGVPVFVPAGGLNQSPYGTLLGIQILPIEHCSTLGTVGDIMLVDMTQYLAIDKGNVASASSIHVNFLYDETVYRWVYRVNGQPWWPAALTPAQGSNTQSPFVALASR